MIGIQKPIKLDKQMRAFLELSKIYVVVLSLVSFFMSVMLLAGSHSGVNLKNQQTLFSVISIVVFVLTVFMLQVFVSSKQMRRKSVKGVILMSLLTACIFISGFSLIKLFSLDLEESSAWVYLGILALTMIIVLGYLILKNLLKLN